MDDCIEEDFAPNSYDWQAQDDLDRHNDEFPDGYF